MTTEGASKSDQIDFHERDDSTVTITEGARRTLTRMTRKVADIERDAHLGLVTREVAEKAQATYARALETILLGGYGGGVTVYRDDDLSLLCQWESGFVLGIIFFERDLSWSQHS